MESINTQSLNMQNNSVKRKYETSALIILEI